MGPTGCPETSVTNYQSTLRNVPEEGRSKRLFLLQNDNLCFYKIATHFASFGYNQSNFIHFTSLMMIKSDQNVWQFYEDKIDWFCNKNIY